MAQSCLEVRSMEARHEQVKRNDYKRQDNEYNDQHEDALATGDSQGKGTAHSGHLHWLPDCTKEPNIFDFSNFDTAPSSGAGNDQDNAARAQSLQRSLYSYETPYSEESVDTSANVNEGQYQVPAV